MPKIRARVVAGGVVAALVAGAGIASIVVPWPTFAREPLSVSAVPEPEASLLSCVGPVVALGRDASNAAARSDAAAQQMTAAAAADHTAPVESALAAPDVGGGTGPTSYRAEPEQRVRTDIAAAGSAAVQAEDLAGFAASACAPPLMESWLVGGSASTGAADLLLLANPGDVAAQVEVTVFGAEGERTPEVGQSVVIAPRTQRILPVASLALGELSPVIRVTSAETPVQVALQASRTRTLVATGLDQVGVTATPAAAQVIPSIPVTAVGGEPAILRVLAPWADTEATVTVTRVGSASPVQTQTVPLPVGAPLELALSDLAAGDYTVRVTAAEPVVAGVWAATGIEQGDDFAWYAAGDELGVPSLVAIARGPEPTLTLTNESAEDVSVQVAADAGAGTPNEVTVGPGESERVSVVEGQTYLLTPSAAGIRGSVTYDGDRQLAAYSVIPADTAASALLVYPQ